MRLRHSVPLLAASFALVAFSFACGGGSDDDKDRDPGTETSLSSGDGTPSNNTPSPGDTTVRGDSTPGSNPSPGASSSGTASTSSSPVSTPGNGSSPAATTSQGGGQPTQGTSGGGSSSPTPAATPLPSSPATVELSSASGQPNSTVTVTMTARGGPIGGLAIDISYDAEVLEIVECLVGDRAVCNPRFDGDTARIAMADERGAEGQLGTLTFRLIGSSGSSSPITPSIITCTTPDVRPLDCGVTSGTVSITS